MCVRSPTSSSPPLVSHIRFFLSFLLLLCVVGLVDGVGYFAGKIFVFIVVNQNGCNIFSLILRFGLDFIIIIIIVCVIMLLLCIDTHNPISTFLGAMTGAIVGQIAEDVGWGQAMIGMALMGTF